MKTGDLATVYPACHGLYLVVDMTPLSELHSAQQHGHYYNLLNIEDGWVAPMRKEFIKILSAS